MKIFDGMQSFFNSIGEYVKNFSTLFYIFLGAFLALSIVVIIITSFAYECKLTKTVDKINKFLERNPRINDDNLVAFNNLMKGSGVPKTLRRQWQQFMLYREHPASYYMSFQHCVENPMRNSTYRQQMTVYKIISMVLVVLSLAVSTFMAVQSFNANLVLQDIVIIPLTILVMYWLISMVLDLVHNAISGDLFQNYQYFEINMDKAMLTLPEFVDYEVLFSQDEIRRGIPVLYAYLQKRAIQEQQELEKARLKSSDHEKFDFDKAGLDGSLVLDRAMRETENFTAQRKKYMQEIERVNNEIAALENNYREMLKEYQRQVQTSKENVESLKEQLEQASSTIEINYIKKQMRDEINRQQLAEKEFDILTDKHNQEIKSLNQEIKRYEEETKNAKEALEAAMLSEFNTYSVKVYNNLEKIVDDKMQDKVDDYKEQIKGLEGQIEEKNEELENVYTRYQEVLSQVPTEQDSSMTMYEEEQPAKKGKKKKKNSSNDAPVDEGVSIDDNIAQDYDGYAQEQPEYQDYQPEYNQEEYQEYDQTNYQPENNYQDYNYESVQQDEQEYNYNDNIEYQPENMEYQPESYDYQDIDGAEYQENYEYQPETEGEYAPLDNEYSAEEYVPLNNEEYTPLNKEEYVPLNEESYDDMQNGEYVPLDNDSYYDNNYDENASYDNSYEYQPLEDTAREQTDIAQPEFNEDDFDIDFNSTGTADSAYNFDFGDEGDDFNFGDSSDSQIEEIAKESDKEVEEEVQDFDINKVLGLYDDLPKAKKDKKAKVIDKPEIKDENGTENLDEELDVVIDDVDELPMPVETKRKAGRPRKVVDEEDIKPKRKVGRPRKQVEVDDDSTLQAPKRRVGRPRKQVVQQENEPKRKVGRPRKAETEQVEPPKRKAGRPRKQTSTIVSKRRVGRPRKEATDNQVLEAPKRKVGRPRKDVSSKRKVGRPRKEVSVNQPKRKVGRPRKNK